MPRLITLLPKSLVCPPQAIIHTSKCLHSHSPLSSSSQPGEPPSFPTPKSGIHSHDPKTSAMETFFSQYENFSRNPEAGLIKEFNRLAVTQRWSQHDKQNFRKTFRSAMVDEFNLRYGIDDKSLASWQNLCRVFNIQPIPESINKCKKVCTCIRQEPRCSFIDLAVWCSKLKKPMSTSLTSSS